MQVIIPTAGKGTRLRPHTHTIAKPLVRVAGKPVLGYILDELKKLNVKEVIFIVGYLGDQIEEYVTENYDFKTKFIVQKELKGQAHAIQLAQSHIKEDVLIWFVDALTDADISKLKNINSDGMIYAQEHDDPESYGIVFPDKDGIIEKIVEKPKNPPSNLANIGLYYIKDYKLLFECIDYLIKNDIQTKGEFYLVDAFNLMIKKGTRLTVDRVNVWLDCGQPDTLLETNRYLLKKQPLNEHKELKSSLIINPVFIAKDAKIENSIVGPYVSVATGAVVKNSIIQNSIIGEYSIVEDSKMQDSLVGARAAVKGTYKRMNVGDDSELNF